MRRAKGRGRSSSDVQEPGQAAPHKGERPTAPTQRPCGRRVRRAAGESHQPPPGGRGRGETGHGNHAPQQPAPAWLSGEGQMGHLQSCPETTKWGQVPPGRPPRSHCPAGRPHHPGQGSSPPRHTDLPAQGQAARESHTSPAAWERPQPLPPPPQSASRAGVKVSGGPQGPPSGGG